MNDYEINDIRHINEFKGISFSKYKLIEVKKELVNSINDNKIENALYMSAELICSGHFKELWEIMLLILGKNIHLANIKLPIYLKIKFDTFKDILNGGYVDFEIKMRNNTKIRDLFAELIIILTYSNKKTTIERVKINKKEFDLTDLNGKLKADNINYNKDVFYKEDPKELFIAINEFCYNLIPKVANMLHACYWIEYVLEFENICNKKKIKCKCERRTFAPVSDKDQYDIIWIIWDALLQQSTKKDKMIIKTMNSLLNLFSIRYSSGVKRKRIYLLYYAVSLITEPINYKNQVLLKNPEMLKQIKSKINLIYKEIKKNEESPKTGYLFKGTQKEKNLEKSIEKMERMNSVNFIPRS